MTQLFPRCTLNLVLFRYLHNYHLVIDNVYQALFVFDRGIFTTTSLENHFRLLSILKVSGSHDRQDFWLLKNSGQFVLSF